MKTPADNLTQAIRDAVDELEACGTCNVTVSIYADDTMLGAGSAAVVCASCAANLEALNLNPTDGEIVG